MTGLTLLNCPQKCMDDVETLKTQCTGCMGMTKPEELQFCGFNVLPDRFVWDKESEEAKTWVKENYPDATYYKTFDDGEFLSAVVGPASPLPQQCKYVR